MYSATLALAASLILFLGFDNKLGKHGETGEAKQQLRDPNPTVRLRAALTLIAQHDPEAVPVLIELLAEVPSPQRRQAEEVLQQLAGEWAPNPALTGDDEVSRRIRRDTWAAWWRHTDGPALLTAFRHQTLTVEDHDQVRVLIERLGDKSFAARERAVTEVVALGRKVVPMLRQHIAQDTDLEKIRRAEVCLAQIAETEVRLPLAAARLLALRRPSGATEALLAHLPFAENELMVEEIGLALKSLIARAGKPEPALLQALADPLPLRRAVAAEALARAGLPHLFEVRKLLIDGDISVRLRTALALARGGDRSAVPALIQLLGELPADKGWQAQDLLFQLAGENPPVVPPGEDAQSAQKRRDAWNTWWQKQGSSVDLARLSAETPILGYTLLVQIDQNNNAGRVVELGRDGKPRWQIENLQFPVDAQMIGDTRVLIAEYNGRRVTERDLKGQILWQKNNLPGSAINVQRLRNGNTFIATENTLVEVNAGGATVFSHQIAGGITAGYKLPNGEIVCLLQQGRCVRLDAKGKELKSFTSGRGGGWTSGLDLLPNGRILIAQPDKHTVTEYDLEGKQVWQASATGITTATRTPNGHTLVASFDGRRVYELDRTGKQVWEHRATFGVFRARRR